MADLGRPSSFKPEYCQMLIDHMSEGLSVESFGGLIGCCRDTVFRWAKEHQDFSDAKKVGEAQRLIFSEKLGIDLMNGKSKGKDGAWAFWMKNTAGWRDRHEVTHDQAKPFLFASDPLPILDVGRDEDDE